MFKKYIFLCWLCGFWCTSQAQQYALFNTKTMVDAFENPAMKSFTLDSSSKFASNFLLPSLNINFANKGDSQDILRTLLNEGKYNTSNLPLGNAMTNRAYVNSNIYLLTFRIFSSHKYNQEMGFAWQLRTDARIDYTNETLAILDSYKRFNSIPFNDILNTRGSQQFYHQFSFSIRENWNKKLAFGLKLSLLSGIAYNKIQIDNSYIYADLNNRLDIGLNGFYKGSFIDADELNQQTLLPTFKNPGLALSFGTTYQSKSGYFLMANIKDVGAIRWGKKSYVARTNTIKSIYNVDTKTSKEINKEIINFAKENARQQSFLTTTNAKADVMISKTFNIYKPSIIISKNIFQRGGDFAFVNTFKINELSASFVPVYNFNNFIMMGIQGMYQTPNFEFYMGSDNLGKTMSLARGINQEDAAVGTGYNGGSFYIGMGIKFGRTVNHPQNLSTMPGVNGERFHNGFFRSLYRLFKK